MSKYRNDTPHAKIFSCLSISLRSTSKTQKVQHHSLFFKKNPINSCHARISPLKIRFTTKFKKKLIHHLEITIIINIRFF